MRRRAGGTGALLILFLGGAFLGTLVAEAVGLRYPALAWLAQSRAVRLGPFPLDLYVLTFTLGFGLKVNLLGAVGALAGILLWWRR